MLYSVDEREGFEYFFKLLNEFCQRDKNLKVDGVEAEGETVISQR